MFRGFWIPAYAGMTSFYGIIYIQKKNFFGLDFPFISAVSALSAVKLFF